MYYVAIWLCGNAKSIKRNINENKIKKQNYSCDWKTECE